MLKKHLTDFFIPHAGNGYAPHSLQKAAIFGMLFMIVLSFTLTNVQSLLWISSKTMVGSVLPAVIVDLTNKARTDDSLGSLHRNALLDEAATLKAQDMAKNQYFAHYSPSGLSPWYWFKKVSYNFADAGENLAIYFTDSSDIVNAWMASPEHRANILNGKYTEIGVGTAEGEYKGYHTVYVVQLFGTPAEASSLASRSTAVQTPAVEQETAVPAESGTNTPAVLAEAVRVDEPVSAVSASGTVTAARALAAHTALAREASSATRTQTKPDIEVTSAGTTIYSDTIATTTNAVPARIRIDTGGSTQDTHAPFALTLATQPNMVLQILYVCIGLFVLVSLLLSICIEIKRQQPLQIGYGIALLFLMFGLFYVHIMLSTGAVIA